MLDMMKLFGITKNTITKDENGEICISQNLTR